MQEAATISSDSPPQPEFSIIVACFQEEATIEEFHARLDVALAAIDREIEIIYVCDGSTDGTLALLQGFFERDPLVTCVIDLAANVGQTNALTAGIQRARGRHYIFIDCDLQVYPEDLGALVAKFDEGYDLVGGARDLRRDVWTRVWLSRIGNAVLSRALGIRIRDMGCGFKIIEGDLMRAFEVGPFRPLDPGEIMVTLRRIAEVPISHQSRKHGRSHWTWRRLFRLYHNVFNSILPGIFPFAVGILFVFLLALFGYFVGAWIAPGIFPLAESPVLMLLLITLHMIVSLAFFLLLGEFVLLKASRTSGPAYVVRRAWFRPWHAAMPTPCRE